jgi:hypothetical protein
MRNVECGVGNETLCLKNLGETSIPNSEICIPKLFDSLNIDFDEGKTESCDQWTDHQTDQSESLDAS